MSKTGHLHFSGDDAEVYMMLKPGREFTFTIKAKLTNTGKDEFGMHADFNIIGIDGQVSQDVLTKAVINEMHDTSV